jgi:hypothetical protein
MDCVDSFAFAEGLPDGDVLIFGAWFPYRYQESYGVHQHFAIVFILF